MTSTADMYLAPFHPEPIDAVIAVPGSKSLTNRAMVLSALADGPSRLRAPLRSRDTELMAAALRALGHHITEIDDGWLVEPGVASTSTTHVDCGLAGTVMRFVPPVAALSSATVRFDGDPRARERPMSTTIDSLRALGVNIIDEARGALPFTLIGAGSVSGGTLDIDASASSQFVSALLLVAPRFDNGLDLRHVGPSLPSLPHVDMTVRELRRRGVTVEVEEDRWRVAPGPIGSLDATIEPDLSNAGVFIGAALVTGGRVRVRHWPSDTDQAGDRWKEIVSAFGGTWSMSDGDLVVEGPATICPVDLDLHDVGELTPVVAAIAALSSGPSTLRGVAHLRGHETDRLKALATELNRLNSQVTELPDGLRIVPARLTGAEFRTYEDHRIAHAAAVLGLVVDGVRIENIDTTAKTFPGFGQLWREWTEES